jgi:GrpB-like predicted nucleotidyltransferase (UPF0157 family)
MSNTVHFSRSPELFAAANRLYERTKYAISNILPEAEIHHVGSTAIPGSLTKGDLDIVVRINAAAFAQADTALADAYDRNMGSDKTDSFSAFLDGTASPELGIQLVAIGSELDTFVAWQRLLESDSKLRAEYDQLKSSYEGQSMTEYRLAKSEFIARHVGG